MLSDIHSNLEALAVALRALDEESVDEVLCCGDIVGYGPDPNECIELLKQRQVRSVRGNHDAAALLQTDLTRLNQAGRQAIHWTRKRLSPGSRAFLEGLPTMEQIELEGTSIFLVHGSPADPLWGYILRRRDAYLGFRLDERESYLQLFGHTHLPVLFTLAGGDVRRDSIHGDCQRFLQKEERYLLNPGSVGQPRDGDWRTSLCILEVEGPRSWQWQAQFRRLEYDVERTRQKILRAGLPEELGTRLLAGV